MRKSMQWHGPAKAKKPPAGIEGITYVLGDYVGNGTGTRRRRKANGNDLVRRRAICEANLSRAQEINPTVEPSWYLISLREAVATTPAKAPKRSAKAKRSVPKPTPAAPVSVAENGAEPVSSRTVFTRAEAFRMSGAELSEHVANGVGTSAVAAAEIERRRAKRAAKRDQVAV